MLSKRIFVLLIISFAAFSLPFEISFPPKTTEFLKESQSPVSHEVRKRGKVSSGVRPEGFAQPVKKGAPNMIGNKARTKIWRVIEDVLLTLVAFLRIPVIR